MKKRKKKCCKHRKLNHRRVNSKHYYTPVVSIPMFEQERNNIYDNWGASSSFSARSNGVGKSTNFSKPGSGNFFPYQDQQPGLGNEKLPLKKSFNLFGNSSDLKKQSPWSHTTQGSSAELESSFIPSGDDNQKKLHIADSHFTSQLFENGNNYGKANSHNTDKLFGNNPPSTNLTIHRDNGVATFSINENNSSPQNSVSVTFGNYTSLQPKSRLGKLFSYFKRDNKPKEKLLNIHKTPHVTPKTFSSPSYKAIDARRIGSMKRLVLKSKPIKYHLIDVNRVLSSKRGVAVATNVSATKLLTQDVAFDDDVEDTEEEVQYKPFTSNVLAKNFEEKETPNPVTEKQDGKETSAQQHNGYWTYPSIEDIAKMDPTSLEGVRNFIIGRVGYGQIAYDYPVDLTRLVANAENNGHLIAEELFDNIVILKQSAVLVYQGIDDKPPLGTELNVPATITLEGVKPKPNLSMENHIDFLKRQIGMEFVTYDPITYAWVFKVKHFSIWGLVDEDDENQKDLVLLKRKQDLKEADALVEYSKLYSDDSLDQEVKKQKLNEYSKFVPGGWGSTLPPDDSLLKLKQSLVTDEISGVLNLYRELEDDTMAGRVGGITIDSDIDEIEEVEEVKLNAYEPVITDIAVFDDIKNKSTFPTTDNWLLQLELANQYNSAMAPMVPESKFPKGELTLSKVDEMLFSQTKIKSKSALDQKGLGKSKTALEDVSEKTIDFIFGKIISQCELAQLTDLMPQLRANGLTFAQLANKRDNSVLNSQIELASILFDSSNDIESNRLALFGEWLQRYNENQIADLLEANKGDELYCTFFYLCVNRKEEAIERTLISKNEHLAVILSLADSKNSLVKELATEQLETWKETDSEKYIPKSLVSIYQLLARQLDQVVENLPWTIVFGVFLYYGDVENLKEFIGNFESKLPKEDPVADLLRLQLNGIDFTSMLNSNFNKTLKWLICLVLADFDYDELSKNLGDVLEKAGMWKEALVVFSSISDDNLKTRLIRSLIITRVAEEPISEHDEKYLITVLKVPRSLIYEAKALERKNAGDYWSEVNALVEVDLWSKAHEAIVTQLGPQTVIKNSPSGVNKLLNLIDQFPQHGSIIPSWNKGAGIYQNYLKLLENTNDIEVIIFLIEFLPLTKPESAKEKLAINTIAKFVGDLALEDKRVPQKEREKIFQMPLDKVNKAYFELRLSRAN